MYTMILFIFLDWEIQEVLLCSQRARKSTTRTIETASRLVMNNARRLSSASNAVHYPPPTALQPRPFRERELLLKGRWPETASRLPRAWQIEFKSLTQPHPGRAIWYRSPLVQWNSLCARRRAPEQNAPVRRWKALLKPRRARASENHCSLWVTISKAKLFSVWERIDSTSASSRERSKSLISNRHHGGFMEWCRCWVLEWVCACAWARL